ncbi:MAG: dihydrolipoamide acetyltransferase family protein [Reyranella sp.]|uniref:dihydrolipoamide acetyltransferase family protein n=1 Tax=Reyranella sp. TaxID=1929291 RepID=UPI002731B878|nr:dihydrolipoamide acetyltransferase family protein [Reyranella sp.]MDP1965951.1 dihydrolipoamide acetyltransferase family protein [Reyranella sp.]MDP2374325.1 dihydrolipoamide acetyltransferase family protein [Reyranella sp.]
MSDFRMPSLGADMDKGKVVEWLKKPGDRIVRGDVVAVVETQKGAFEIEVFEEGVLSEILVAVGSEVPVGAVLARINGVGAAPPAAAPPLVSPPPGPPVHPAPPPTPTSATPTPATPTVPAMAPGERLRISPAAARRALELGVDVRGLRGGGPQGAIAVADVEAAATKKPAAPAPRRGFDPAAMRQAIALAMARSKREIPHYYLSLPIDMGRALEWLADANARRDVEHRLLPGVLLLKATALALRRVPELNGFWVDGAPKLSAAIHLGWAISLRGGGLIAPAIRDADKLTIDQAMSALRDLVMRARTARIRGSEMMDPTITVTSLGERGAESVLGVIYPPQLAILGFGAPRKAPAVVAGQLAVRPLIRATLSGDHRATDGEAGSRLLSAIDGLLQKPEDL